MSTTGYFIQKFLPVWNHIKRIYYTHVRGFVLPDGCIIEGSCDGGVMVRQLQLHVREQ